MKIGIHNCAFDANFSPMFFCRGSFGVVYKGSFRGTEVAVKKLIHQTFSQQQVEELMGEINIMKYDLSKL